MASQKMTIKHKAMAYVLNKEFGYSMTKIGNLMSVSQSTISNAIKDFSYQLIIQNLNQELVNARNEIKKLGLTEPDIITITNQL